jgi:hypothetical protein
MGSRAGNASSTRALTGTRARMAAAKLTGGETQDFTGFFFHRTTMSCSPHSQTLLHMIIEVANGKTCHESASLQLASSKTIQLYSLIALISMHQMAHPLNPLGYATNNPRR